MRTRLLVTLAILLLAPVAASREPVVAAAAPDEPDCVVPGQAPSDVGWAVVVYAHPQDVPSRHASSVDALRELVHETSRALYRDSGSTRSYRVQCDAFGRVEVVEHRLALSKNALSFDAVKADVVQRGGLSGRINYWVWVDATTPNGELARADLVLERRWTGDEVNRGGHAVVIWGRTAWSLDHRVLMHESAHTMGAVARHAWESDPGSPGHTYAEMDVLNARLDTPSVTRYLACTTPVDCPCGTGDCLCGSCGDCEPTKLRCGHARCDEWTFDCGKDTYFHPDATRRLHTRVEDRNDLTLGWQVGSENNAFLRHVPRATTPIDCNDPTTVVDPSPGRMATLLLAYADKCVR